MRRTILLALLLVVATRQADAKTLYVNAASGSDAVSYAANDADHPWATLCRATNGSSACGSSSTNAAQAAKAGDVVLIASGVYRAPGTGLRFLSPFNPANSGTATAPITFRCATARACVLALSASEGPVFGCRSRDYIIWDGFAVDGVVSPSTSDTGHVDFFSATGCALLNSTISGNPAHPNTGQGNYNAVRLEATREIVLRGNILSDIAEAGVYGGNQAAVMLYDADDTLIEYNTIARVGNGVYIKGTHDVPGESQARTTVRANFLYDVRFNCLDTLSAQGATLTQNICIAGAGGTNGATVFGFPPSANVGVQLHSVDYTHNVFIGFTNCFNYEGVGGVAYHRTVRAWNNICRTASVGTRSWSLSGPGDTKHEHTLYSDVSTAAHFGRPLALQEWQALGQDAALPSAASTSGPLFVAEAPGPSGDFHLAPGSAGATLGRTFAGAVVPVGAYITGREVIGHLGADGGGAPAPVDCVVSAWALQSSGPWSACAAQQQSRVESWARTILTPAAHGGAACPALTETRTGTQACAEPETVTLTCTVSSALAPYADGDLKRQIRCNTNGTVTALPRGATFTVIVPK